MHESRASGPRHGPALDGTMTRQDGLVNSFAYVTAGQHGSGILAAAESNQDQGWPIFDTATHGSGIMAAVESHQDQGWPIFDTATHGSGILAAVESHQDQGWPTFDTATHVASWNINNPALQPLGTQLPRYSLPSLDYPTGDNFELFSGLSDTAQIISTAELGASSRGKLDYELSALGSHSQVQNITDSDSYTFPQFKSGAITTSSVEELPNTVSLSHLHGLSS